MMRFGPSTRRQAIGVVVPAGLMVAVTVWLVARDATPSRVTVALALQLGAALLGIWIARSYITLEPDHLRIVNMTTSRIAYREIAAVDVRTLRSRLVMVTLKDGTNVTLGPSVGLDVDAIATAIGERLPGG